MSVLDPLLKRVRAFDPEALLNLAPSWPPVAVEVDRGQLTLARVRAGRERPLLEAYRVHAASAHAVGASIFRPNLGSIAEMAAQIKDLYEKSGTKPGKVSVILPDNLAKVSIVSLPEKPAGRRELSDLLRFKLRRSVPFRLEDAVISHAALPGAGPGLDLLVAVMLRSVVEQYEAAFDAAGARPGLVDLATPSLHNLARPEIDRALADGEDAALLNCARTYFTLMILKRDRLVFYRCKSYAASEDEVVHGNGTMARELASSISYYQEKLAGTGIGTVFVRTVAQPLGDIVAILERLGIGDVRPIDPARLVDSGSVRLDDEDAQRVAPALGAAAGRAA